MSYKLYVEAVQVAPYMTTLDDYVVNVLETLFNEDEFFIDGEVKYPDVGSLAVLTGFNSIKSRLECFSDIEIVYIRAWTELGFRKEVERLSGWKKLSQS